MSVATAVVGTVAMAVFADVFPADDRAAALALGFSLAHLVGVALLAPGALRRHDDRIAGVIA